MPTTKKKPTTKETVLELNEKKIPIWNLRQYLGGLVNAGIDEVPVGALILEIQRIYNETKEDRQEP